jgi:hypothetical protein
MEERRLEESRAHFESEERQRQRAEQQKAAPKAKAKPDPEPSFASQLAGGTLKALVAMLAFGGAFFGLFWLLQKGMRTGTGDFRPHRVEPVGPIDRDRVRNFVNTPSAPTPDLGVGDASDWNEVNDYG